MPHKDLETHIVAATLEVFDTMVMLAAKPGPAQLQQSNFFSESISSLLGFSGDLQGLLGVHCPTPVANFITGALLGAPGENTTEELHDAMGEITNMIAGGIKTSFAGGGTCLELSIPATVSGKAYSVSKLPGASGTCVPFAIAGGQLLVDLKFLKRS